MLGVSRATALNIIQYRDKNFTFTGGHMAWFDAGYYNNLNIPASWSYYFPLTTGPNPQTVLITYSAISGVFPVAAPLSQEDTGPLRYHAGSSPEQTGNRFG